jgi:nicotinamide-nucleotide amidase
MHTLLTPATRCAALLVARGETIAVAESSSGGLISAALLSVPGASAFFRGGDVLYTRLSRAAWGIPNEAMEGIRSASEPYAKLLANTARERLGTTWGLSETGAAGPAGNSYGDDPGHVCLAVAGPVDGSLTIETGQTDRLTNMRAFALAALDLLEKALHGA